MLINEERRKSEYQEEKPLDAEKRTDKFNPHMKQSLVIESGTTLMETSVLTITSSLLPEAVKSLKETIFYSDTKAGLRDNILKLNEGLDNASKNWKIVTNTPPRKKVRNPTTQVNKIVYLPPALYFCDRNKMYETAAECKFSDKLCFIINNTLKNGIIFCLD